MGLAPQTAWPPQGLHPRPPSPTGKSLRPPGRALRNAGGGEDRCPAPPLRPPPQQACLFCTTSAAPRGTSPRAPTPLPGPRPPAPPGPLAHWVLLFPAALKAPPPTLQSRMGSAQAAPRRPQTRVPEVSSWPWGAEVLSQPAEDWILLRSLVGWSGLGGPRSPQGRVLGEGEPVLGWLSPGGDGPLSCPVPGSPTS